MRQFVLDSGVLSVAAQRRGCTCVMYHVVMFANSKSENETKYAFVSELWVIVHRPKNNMAVIVYPSEDSSIEERVRNNEIPAADWKRHLCEIVLSTYDVNEAVLSTMRYTSVASASVYKGVNANKHKSNTIDLNKEPSSSKKRRITSQVQNNTTPSEGPMGSSTPIAKNNTATTEKNVHDNTSLIKSPAFSNPKNNKNPQNEIISNKKEEDTTPNSVKSSYSDNKKHENKIPKSIPKSPEIVSTTQTKERTLHQDNTSGGVKRKVQFKMDKNTKQSKDPTQLSIPKVNNGVIDNRHNLTKDNDSSVMINNDEQNNKALSSKESIDFSAVDNCTKDELVKNLNKPPIFNASRSSADKFVKPNMQSEPANERIIDDAQRPTNDEFSTTKNIEIHENTVPKSAGSAQVIENNQANINEGNKMRKFLEKIDSNIYEILKGTIEIINAMNDYTSKHLDIEINASKQPNIGTKPEQNKEHRIPTLNH
ncbi:homeobox protein 2 [Manduca sexta]|uniref:homeobox protein 2 n=1 Tax=Manduca sexta TaxID=7130 RepID=UPI00188DFE6B|nr:homeobox protein 2 [Manduca sexta]